MSQPFRSFNLAADQVPIPPPHPLYGKPITPIYWDHSLYTGWATVAQGGDWQLPTRELQHVAVVAWQWRDATLEGTIHVVPTLPEGDAPFSHAAPAFDLPFSISISHAPDSSDRTSGTFPTRIALAGSTDWQTLGTYDPFNISDPAAQDQIRFNISAAIRRHAIFTNNLDEDGNIVPGTYVFWCLCLLSITPESQFIDSPGGSEADEGALRVLKPGQWQSHYDIGADYIGEANYLVSDAVGGTSEKTIILRSFDADGGATPISPTTLGTGVALTITAYDSPPANFP